MKENDSLFFRSSSAKSQVFVTLHLDITISNKWTYAWNKLVITTIAFKVCLGHVLEFITDLCFIVKYANVQSQCKYMCLQTMALHTCSLKHALVAGNVFSKCALIRKCFLWHFLKVLVWHFFHREFALTINSVEFFLNLSFSAHAEFDAKKSWCRGTLFLCEILSNLLIMCLTNNTNLLDNKKMSGMSNLHVAYF